MQLTAVFLLGICLQVSATALSQSVTFSGKDVPLETVFESVKKQTGYFVSYKSSQIVSAKPVTINATGLDVKDFLIKVLKDQELDFLIKGKTIFIRSLTDNKAPVFISPNENTPPLTGIIRDADGNPIAGANIVIKGTKRGVTTDANGKYSIDIAAGETLIISSIGYNAKELKVNNTNVPFIVALEKSVSQLDEVQYIAYGKQTQRFSVGNVNSVKAVDLEKQPVNNPMLALQGRVPGLFVTQATGNNGAAVKIRVQGENSIANGNDPLIVVDGVPYPSQLPAFDASNLLGNAGGSPLSFLNMEDIESIDVLKDADATSIYGTRAANGAILITTKKGMPGKMRLNLNLQQGFSKVGHFIELLNRRQYLDMRYEAFRNSGMVPSEKTTAFFPYQYAPDLTIWDTTQETNWQKELIGNAAQFSRYSASVAGGAANTNYVVGITFGRNGDVYPGDEAMKNGGLHFNLNNTSNNQKFKMQLTGTYSINDNSLPGVNLTQLAILTVPVAPSLYAGDTINWALDSKGIDTWDNPLAASKHRQYNSTGRTLFSSLYMSYTLFTGLELRGQFGYNQIQTTTGYKSRLESYRPSIRSTQPRFASFQNNFLSNLSIDPQLNFDRKYGHLKLNILIGGAFQQNNMESTFIAGSGYLSDLQMNGISGAATVGTVMDKTIYKYNGLFSRINAIWNDQLILNLNIRRDGSSRFGDERRFHNFSSVAAGWIFTENNFIDEHLPWLSFGKLRASYGTSGSDNLGDYRYLSANVVFDPGMFYQGTLGLFPGGLHNPFVQWEENKKLSGGIDIGILKDRVLLNVTYARNRCSNQLINYDLPGITGFDFVQANLPATVQNTSWELSLNTINFKTKDASWTSNINLTVPRNRVVAFPGIENTPYRTPQSGIVVGQPIGTIQVGKYRGMDPATGVYQGSDVHGNPISGVYFSDYLNLLPIYYGGFQNAISYKNFQLDFLFMFVRQLGSREHEFWNGVYAPGYTVRADGNQPVAVLSRWQKPGDQAENAPYSTLNTNDPMRVLGKTDSFYSVDASYVRLKNASLSWRIPASFLRKIGLQSGRIYTQGQNLLTITKYSGLDPESQNLISLPPLRTWTFGLQVSL